MVIIIKLHFTCGKRELCRDVEKSLNILFKIVDNIIIDGCFKCCLKKKILPKASGDTLFGVEHNFYFRKYKNALNSESCII